MTNECGSYLSACTNGTLSPMNLAGIPVAMGFGGILGGPVGIALGAVGEVTLACIMGVAYNAYQCYFE